MAQEGQKEKAGGMAYEVILKPATNDAAPLRPASPPKGNKDANLSQEAIERKLKEAEERRLSMEAAKLQHIAKDKERMQVAQLRIQEDNKVFSKTAEKRLSAKFEVFEENKNAQIKALQDRLRDHAKKVMEVRKTSEQYGVVLKERIEKKMTTMQMNRESQLGAIQERLKEHERHIQDVLDSSAKFNAKFSEETEERLVQRMETTLKNREEQLRQLTDKLQDHGRHIEKVRQSKVAPDGTDASS